MIIGIALLLLFIAWLPTFTIWHLAKYYLSPKFIIKPLKMSLVCIGLSFATGAILNLELEGGLLSAFVAMLVLSFCWSILSLPILLVLQRSRGQNT